jgi:hypothetical protein
MDEIRGRIDPHTSAVQADRSSIKVAEREAGDADIDRLTEKVEAVLGDAPAVGPQESVSAGRPIAGDDMEGLVRRDLPGERVEEVEKADVDILLLPGPVVP